MSAPDEPKPQVDIMVENIDGAGAVKAVGVEEAGEGAASALTSVRRVSAWAFQMAASSSWASRASLYMRAQVVAIPGVVSQPGTRRQLQTTRQYLTYENT